MEKYNKQKAILTALLKWVETEFFGIFVFLFFIAVAKPFGALANIIFGLTGLLTVVCLMADFGLKQERKPEIRSHSTVKMIALTMASHLVLLQAYHAT